MSVKAALARYPLLWFFALTQVPLAVSQRLGTEAGVTLLFGTAGPIAVLLLWAADDAPRLTRRTGLRLVTFAVAAAGLAVVLHWTFEPSSLSTLALAGSGGFVLSCLLSPTQSIRDLVWPLLAWRRPWSLYAFALLAFPLLAAALVIVSRVGYPGGATGGGPGIGSAWSEIAHLCFGTLALRAAWIIGWYGFAARRLLTRCSPLLTGVLLGAIEASVYWLPSNGGVPVADFARFLATTVALTIVSLWLFQRTQGSLLAVLVLQAAALGSTYAFIWAGPGWFDYYWALMAATCLLALCLVVGWRMWRGPDRGVPVAATQQVEPEPGWLERRGLR